MTWIIFSIVAGLLVVGLLLDAVCWKNPAKQDVAWRVILLGLVWVPAVFLIATAFIPDGLVALPVLENQGLASVAENPSTGHHSQVVAVPRNDAVEEAVVPSVMSAPKSVGSESKPAGWWSATPFLGWKFFWLAGAVTMLAYFAAGWMGLQRLRSGGVSDIPDRWTSIIGGVSRTVGLKSPLIVQASKSVFTPMVVGIFRPVVLVPESLVESNNPTKIEAVLLHEAMHVARRDTVWNLVLCLVVAVWWPIPLVFLMRKRMNWLRELLCDIGVAKNMEVTEYATVLLELATLQQPRRMSLVAMPMKSPTSMLESRIQWLFSNPLSIVAPPRQLVFAICMTFFGITATVATVRLVPKLAATVQDQDLDSRILSGVVRGPDEQVVADAQVFLFHAPEGRYSLSRDPKTPVVKTDRQGRFEFNNLKPGEYRVWAEANGLISLDHIFNGEKFNVPEKGKFGHQVDLVLHEGCNYEVSVFDSESQEPIVGASVSFGYGDVPRSYATDENGVASIRGVPICDWYFVVKADGYGTVHKPSSKQKLGTTTKMKMELGKGSGIFGVLLDQKGDAISDARVYVSSDELGMAPAYEQVVTDSEGEFAIGRLPTNEKLRIQMGKADHKFRTFYIELSNPGEPEEVHIDGEVLPYGGDVNVKVVDKNGDPIEGIELINRGNGSGRTRNATTDANGEGRLENLYHYQGCRVAVRGRGMIPKTIPVEPGPEGEPVTVEVELEPGKTIRGRVVDPEGNPIERVMLLVFAGIDFVTLEDLKWERIYSDKNGNFEITGLEEPTKIRVMPRYQGDFREIKGYEVDFEKEEQLIELKYGAELRLRAIDHATGEAIPEFNVKLDLVEFGRRKPGDISNGVLVTYQEPGVNIHGDTKEFRLRGQPLKATYKVIISAEGYETRTIHRMEVKVKPELMDVQLKRKS